MREGGEGREREEGRGGEREGGEVRGDEGRRGGEGKRGEGRGGERGVTNLQPFQ